MKKIIFIVLLSFSFIIKAQINESFEGAFPPEGWIVYSSDTDEDDGFVHQEDFESAYGTIGHAHTGEYGVLSSFFVYESWLVTPQHTPTAENHMLYWHHRQKYVPDYGDSFSVKISTASQDNHDDFTTTIATFSEEDLSFDMFEPAAVDLSDFIGQPIYIAFIHIVPGYDDYDGDEWYIDDVLTDPIEYPGLCTNPIPADETTNVIITNTQTSVIDLSWDAPTDGGEVLQYDLWIGHYDPEEDELVDVNLIGHPTEMEAHPKTFHFNTVYFWAAAPNNMMGYNPDIEGWAFMTSPQPIVTTPYVIDFENDGFVPDACDQFMSNDKWWEYAEVPTGHVGNNGNFEGTTTESGGYFAFIDDSDVPNCFNTTFSTPYIDFSGIDQPAFSFYINSNGEDGANVDFSIKTRIIGDDEPGEAIYSSNTNTSGWEKVVVNLDAVDCTTPLQLLFVIDENVDSTKDDLAIDDITFDEYENLAVNTETITDLGFFPNPVQDLLTVHADETISKVEIYNLIGQLVIEVSTDKATTSIDTSKLNSGNYIVKVFSNNKQNTLKFVKE